MISRQIGQQVGQGTSYYRPELDALRFGAFLAVFAHHALWRLGTPSQSWISSLQAVAGDAGSFGMCLFFMLSAFLITELLRREHEATGTVALGSFYCRRILRIWPLYLAFLAICWTDGRVFFRSEPAIETARILAFVFLVGNWYTAWHGWTSNPAAPLWSISLEEQFYFVWPPLFRFGGPRGVAKMALGLIPVSMATIVILVRTSPNLSPGIWVNTLVQFQYFAIGAFLALRLAGSSPSLSGPIRLGLAAAGIALWILGVRLFPVFDPQPHHPFGLLAGYECAALGTGLLFFSVLGISSAKVPGSITYLGKISYGLYVFHFLCLGAARHVQTALANHHLAPRALPGIQLVAIASVLTAALAALSYRFFERPFLRLKERFAVIRSRPI